LKSTLISTGNIFFFLLAPERTDLIITDIKKKPISIIPMNEPIGLPAHSKHVNAPNLLKLGEHDAH
jgi:hypothetical protein